MKRLPTEIDDLVLIEPDVHGDERGFFVEAFRRSWMEEGAEPVCAHLYSR